MVLQHSKQVIVYSDEEKESKLDQNKADTVECLFYKQINFFESQYILQQYSKLFKILLQMYASVISRGHSNKTYIQRH